MRTIFPSFDDRHPARKNLRQALVFSILLILVWAALALMPATPPDPAISGAPGISQEVENQPVLHQERRSLIGPGYIFALVLLGGGALLALRIRKMNPAGAAPGGLREIGRLRTGQGQNLQLIACAGEVHLIGSTTNGITLLKSYPASEFVPTQTPVPDEKESTADVGPQNADLEWTVASAASINDGPDFLTLLRRYANKKTYKANTLSPPTSAGNSN